MAYKRLTQEEVIRRFCEVHGSRYDYSSVEYKGYDRKVTIICRQHGAFEQEVGVHLKGWGCPICGDITRARKKKKSTQQFIDEAKRVHGDKYDYGKTIYRGANKKVIITCREHGDFEQFASQHLKGCGCPACVGKGVVTMENFIDLARAIHGDKYGYDRVSFTKVSDKVWINCPKHGWFQQAVSSHIRRKMGCQKCANEEKAKERVKSKDEFVRQAREVHGDRYDYSKSVYINTRTKILIICKNCGSEFWQTPQNHISSCRPSGCPSCGVKHAADSIRTSLEVFIDKANVVHDSKYGYEKVSFNTLADKVFIRCDKHGYFLQEACSHLRGCGCPFCKRSIGEERVSRFLGEHDIEHIEQYRIKNENLFCENTIMVVDFYLPNQNIIIEYNGQQHYRPLDVFGGIERFEGQQERDMSLRQYCKEHKIRLIEIPYTDYDNIETILTKELNIKKHD